MEKQRICKICNKRFSNGKAMGGHMRSHLAKLPIPPKPESPPLQHHHHHHLHQLSDSPESSSPCPLFSSSYRGMHSSAVLNNREPSLDSAIHDGNSDSESHPRKPTRRRSKRRRKVIGKAAETPFEAEQVSSVSDTFSTEDVARCLIMLSMDKWEKVKFQKQLGEFADEDEEDEDDEEEDDSGFRARTQTGTRGKFKCETCNKAFRSYQALGGHRASHKKLKAPVFDEEEEDDFEEQDDVHDHGNARNFVVEQRRTFECSFCFKQFDSGQALGGHKKVHYYNQLINNVNVNARNVNANASSSSNNFVDNLVIDLNLPAPEEEEEEVSQVEFSTVSE